MNFSEAKVKKRKKVIRNRKISISSCNSFSSASGTVKHRLSTLSKNNKALADALQNVRCELSRKQSYLDNCMQDISKMLLSKIKIKNLYCSLKTFMKEFEEILDLLNTDDKDWSNLLRSPLDLEKQMKSPSFETIDELENPENICEEECDYVFGEENFNDKIHSTHENLQSPKLLKSTLRKKIIQVSEKYKADKFIDSDSNVISSNKTDICSSAQTSNNVTSKCNKIQCCENKKNNTEEISNIKNLTGPSETSNANDNFTKVRRKDKETAVLDVPNSETNLKGQFTVESRYINTDSNLKLKCISPVYATNFAKENFSKIPKFRDNCIQKEKLNKLYFQNTKTSKFLNKKLEKTSTLDGRKKRDAQSTVSKFLEDCTSTIKPDIQPSENKVTVDNNNAEYIDFSDHKRKTFVIKKGNMLESERRKTYVKPSSDINKEIPISDRRGTFVVVPNKMEIEKNNDFEKYAEIDNPTASNIVQDVIKVKDKSHPPNALKEKSMQKNMEDFIKEMQEQNRHSEITDTSSNIVTSLPSNDICENTVQKEKNTELYNDSTEILELSISKFGMMAEKSNENVKEIIEETNSEKCIESKINDEISNSDQEILPENVILQANPNGESMVGNFKNSSISAKENIVLDSLLDDELNPGFDMNFIPKSPTIKNIPLRKHIEKSKNKVFVFSFDKRKSILKVSRTHFNDTQIQSENQISSADDTNMNYCHDSGMDIKRKTVHFQVHPENITKDAVVLKRKNQERTGFENEGGNKNTKSNLSNIENDISKISVSKEKSKGKILEENKTENYLENMKDKNKQSKTHHANIEDDSNIVSENIDVIGMKQKKTKNASNIEVDSNIFSENADNNKNKNQTRKNNSSNQCDYYVVCENKNILSKNQKETQIISNFNADSNTISENTDVADKKQKTKNVSNIEVDSNIFSENTDNNKNKKQKGKNVSNIEFDSNAFNEIRDISSKEQKKTIISDIDINLNMFGENVDDISKKKQNKKASCDIEIGSNIFSENAKNTAEKKQKKKIAAKKEKKCVKQTKAVKIKDHHKNTKNEAKSKFVEETPCLEKNKIGVDTSPSNSVDSLINCTKQSKNYSCKGSEVNVMNTEINTCDTTKKLKGPKSSKRKSNIQQCSANDTENTPPIKKGKKDSKKQKNVNPLFVDEIQMEEQAESVNSVDEIYKMKKIKNRKKSCVKSLNQTENINILTYAEIHPIPSFVSASPVKVLSEKDDFHKIKTACVILNDIFDTENKKELGLLHNTNNDLMSNPSFPFNNIPTNTVNIVSHEQISTQSVQENVPNRRRAGKQVSYKEPPLNVKMRR